MTRFVAVFVAAAASLAGAGVARAQLMATETGMLPGGAKLTWNKFYIKQGGQFVEPPDPETRRRYLNLAHCTCAQAGAGDEREVQYDLGLSADTNSNSEGALSGEAPVHKSP